LELAELFGPFHEGHAGNAAFQEAQFSGGDIGDVEDAWGDIRSPIIDHNIDAFSIGKVCDFEPSSERELEMGAGEGVLFETGARGGLTTVEARSIPGGESLLSKNRGLFRGGKSFGRMFFFLLQRRLGRRLKARPGAARTDAKK